jgi:hypothetical protein
MIGEADRVKVAGDSITGLPISAVGEVVVGLDVVGMALEGRGVTFSCVFSMGV